MKGYINESVIDRYNYNTSIVDYYFDNSRKANLMLRRYLFVFHCFYTGGFFVTVNKPHYHLFLFTWHFIDGQVDYCLAIPHAVIDPDMENVTQHRFFVIRRQINSGVFRTLSATIKSCGDSLRQIKALNNKADSVHDERPLNHLS